MDFITRKSQTDEPGNRGEFGTHQHTEPTAGLTPQHKVSLRYLRQIHGATPIETAEGLTYLPVDGGSTIGYEVIREDGATEYCGLTPTVDHTGAQIHFTAATRLEANTGAIEPLDSVPLFQERGDVPETDGREILAGTFTLGGFGFTFPHVRLQPFANEHRVGYLAIADDGRQEIVSLVPSTGTDEGEGTGNAFLYWTNAVDIDDLGDPRVHTAFFSD